eukprot:6193343-Pleurochrysis_carterae.AAC.1
MTSISATAMRLNACQTDTTQEVDRFAYNQTCDVLSAARPENDLRMQCEPSDLRCPESVPARAATGHTDGAVKGNGERGGGGGPGVSDKPGHGERWGW